MATNEKLVKLLLTLLDDDDHDTAAQRAPDTALWPEYCNVPVLVCDSTRGLTFGVVERFERIGDTVCAHMKNTRHIYYWASRGGNDDGVTALATHGVVADKSRVGPVVARHVRNNVAGVYVATPEAAKTFEAAKWSR